MLKRRYVEFAWWVPAGRSRGGALVADSPLALHLMIRNHAPARLFVARMRLFCSSAIELQEPPGSTQIPPRKEIELVVEATPRAAGYWFFHGMSLSLRDRFGMFAMHVYYPNLMGIKVFPPLGVGRAPIPFRPRTGAFHERAGQRTVRQPGLGSDLREIREHTPGDPFKRIAWKATARLRKLMVRELESEILVTHWLLLDISSTMRAGGPGQSKLDYGLSLCAGFARMALEAGDRTGLITFDHRIYSHVRPSDGSTQLYRIIDRLMELHNIVDEDLTDLTDPELVAAVADYLRYQEGVNVRHTGRPPPAGDPAWDQLLMGPRGELYSASLVDRSTEKVLHRRTEQGGTRWQAGVAASTPRASRLRQLCREVGLEIPYRQHSFVEGKERGMAEALRRAGALRHSQFIVLLTDLEEIEEMESVMTALRLARSRHHSISVVAPFGPDFLPPPITPHDRRVRNIVSLRGRRRRDAVRKTIERMGIPVLSASPHQTLHLLLRRLSRVRASRTGVGAP
jgi:uncharacterized protein (DUF58 family)